MAGEVGVGGQAERGSQRATHASCRIEEHEHDHLVARVARSLEAVQVLDDGVAHAARRLAVLRNWSPSSSKSAVYPSPRRISSASVTVLGAWWWAWSECDSSLRSSPAEQARTQAVSAWHAELITASAWQTRRWRRRPFPIRGVRARTRSTARPCRRSTSPSRRRCSPSSRASGTRPRLGEEVGTQPGSSEPAVDLRRDRRHPQLRRRSPRLGTTSRSRSTARSWSAWCRRRCMGAGGGRRTVVAHGWRRTASDGSFDSAAATALRCGAATDVDTATVMVIPGKGAGRWRNEVSRSFRQPDSTAQPVLRARRGAGWPGRDRRGDDHARRRSGTSPHRA